MGDLCFGLLGIVLGLALLAGVVHGFSVLLRSLDRMLLGTPAKETRDPASQHCVGCGRSLDGWMIQCLGCGLPRNSTLARQLHDVFHVLRQLRDLQDRGLIDEAVVDQVQDAMVARKQALLAELVPAREEPLPVLALADPEPVQAEVAPAPVAAVAAPVVAVAVAASPEPPPAIAELVPEPVAVAPAEPPPRRRPFTELLTAFMEERNILWGEVVGGLLIVGCSVALVISLWQTLQRIPYFPFIIIAAVTASLFGAGLYTLERWKLHSTSRGLLMIASLLVPLDLLVMAGLHRDLGGQFDWLEVGVLGVVLSLFVYLLRRAGQVLLPAQSWLYPTAVLGPSACELAVPMLGSPPGVAAAVLLGTAAAACHGGTACRAIRLAARGDELDEGEAQRLFGFLGVSTFALATLLGLLIYASQAATPLLQKLAPLVAVGGVPLLAGGALVHRRLAEAGTRTAGTVIAMIGAAIQLAAVPLAWPDPLQVGLVCFLNFIVLTSAANRYRLPIAHAPALASLALGYLTVIMLLTGETSLASRWLVSSSAGWALVPLVTVLGLVGEWLLRRDRHADGISYTLAAGLLMLPSLTLVTAGDPYRAATTYFLYAAGILLSNRRWRMPALSYVGLALLPLGTRWLLAGLVPGRWDLWAVILAGEALILGLLSTCRVEEALRRPARDVSAFIGLVAWCITVLTPIDAGLSWTTASWSILAVSVLALAWSYRQRALSYLGAILILATVLNGFAGTVSDWRQPATLLTALLGQATLTGLIARAMQRFGSGEAVDILVRPLDRSTMLATVLSLPLLVFARPDQMIHFMVHAGWLALIWLVIAMERRWAWLFAGFQAALCVAVGFGVTAWLIEQPWLVESYPAGLADPRSLHAYGIGLAGLSLLWAIVRPILKKRALIQDLMEPGWPALDRVVLAELVLLQLGLALAGVLPAVAAERSLTHLIQWPLLPEAFGVHAWVLLGLLTLTLIVRNRAEITALSLAGLVLQGVTAAVLLGGLAAAQQAATPALAWSLAGVFLAGSVLLWLREPLTRLTTALGIPISGTPAPAVRWLLVGGCVTPIVILSLLRLMASAPLRPIEGTFFADVGSLLRQGVPALLLCVTLVGHALRERSPGFAFAAGWAAQLTVIGGYALHLSRNQIPIDASAVAEMLQLGCMVAALWAVAWLASRRWVEGELMTWQCGLAVGGNLVLLLVGLVGLVSWLPGLSASTWTVAAGSWWGWAALALTVLALGWRARLVQVPGTAALVAALGLAGITLLACTLTGLAGPEAGYRAMMLGAAFFALAASLAAVPLPFGDPPEREATGCVALGYGLAVLLGLKAAFLHLDLLWAAGAIGLSACVGALMAAWQRREGWAFAAGLGLNLAVSLLVWHEHRGMTLSGWLHFLLQANAIAGGLVALIWLAARERFMGTGLVATRPYLASQIALPCLINIVLIGTSFLTIFIQPALSTPRQDYLISLSQLGGWLALLLPMAATLWYAPREHRLKLLALHGLGLGVLAGCLAMRWDSGDWLAFHVLTAVWLLVAVGVTALTLLGDEWYEGQHLEYWAGVTGGLVVLLALRGSLGDPGGPWWLAVPVLGVATSQAWLGVWSEQSRYRPITGALFVLAGLLVWQHYWEGNGTALVSMVAMCLALGAALWSAIDRVTRLHEPSFERLARFMALVLLGGLVGTALGYDLAERFRHTTGWLAWMALASLVLAQCLAWWNSRQTAGLYATGLVAVGLLLHQVGGTGAELAWSIGLALAGYVLATTWLARRETPIWFVISQMAVGLAATGLGLWMALHFGGLGERLAGPLAVLLVLSAAALLSDRATLLRPIVFLLGGTLAIALGWSILGQHPLLPWLHRDMVMMLALILSAATIQALKLPAEWHATGRRMADWLIVAALLVLPIVIAQEAFSYNRALDPRRTEVDAWAIVAGAIGCLALIAWAIRRALERGRTGYVYLAEAVLLGLFIHMRMTAPWLFGKWLAPYWMFLVMTVAFVAVGLGELFRRRGLAVLAGPLARTGMLLPLAPLLAFWVNEPAALLRPWAVQVLPGSEPLLNYLELTARAWDKYALLWFLTGALLGGMAHSKASFRLALVAALAANFGLWSLWRHTEVSFLVHPQFFLIPLALIVLAAEYIQRERLSAQQAQSLRYAALTLLYLSSTADMFIAGLDQVGWPLFLMLLCVIGVLLGMLFEVRAYLFLGTGFLFLVIFSMIWHAAVDKQQPWVWYASGIALGAAILALFAVFEKRRNDVLVMLERIRAWD